MISNNNYTLYIGDSNTLGGLCKECQDLSQYSGSNNTRFGIKRQKEIMYRILPIHACESTADLPVGTYSVHLVVYATKHHHYLSQ